MNKSNWISFEAEFIIVDNDENVMNYYNWVQTSEYVMNLLERKYSKNIIKNMIWRELDASQIEIRNWWAKYSIEDAQSELIDLYEMVYDVVYNEMWLYFLNWSVPNQNFDAVVSWWVEKYSKIDSLLRSIGDNYRKATNIWGIHFHIDTDNNFDRHVFLSNAISEIYNKDKSLLLLSDKRHEMVSLVIEALLKLEFLDPKELISELDPINFSGIIWLTKSDIKNILLDWDNPRFSYNYVWLKKPWISYTTEIRTVDGVWNREDLILNTTKIYNLVNDILW